MTEPDDRRPWICPSCGHFLVRADPVACRRCTVMVVAYTGSEQAESIRRDRYSDEIARVATVPT